MIAGITGAPVPDSFPLASDFNEVGAACDIPPKLLAAIAKRETLQVMSAADAATCVSGDNGHGVMQLTSSWPEDWAEPLANISYAATEFIIPAWTYWHGLYGYTGDNLIRLVAATYNEGLGAAIKYHNEGNVDIGTTDDYAAAVLANFNALCDTKTSMSSKITITAHKTEAAPAPPVHHGIAGVVDHLVHPAPKAVTPPPVKAAAPVSTPAAEAVKAVAPAQEVQLPALSIHPKVASATLGGAIVTLAYAILSMNHIHVSDDVVAASTTVLAFILAYVTPSAAQTTPS